MKPKGGKTPGLPWNGGMISQKKASWKNLSEIKVDFPATDYVGNQHYVFNIKGNNYRLVVVVKFTIGYIFIRKVCTHEEYDMLDCSNHLKGNDMSKITKDNMILR